MIIAAFFSLALEQQVAAADLSGLRLSSRLELASVMGASSITALVQRLRLEPALRFFLWNRIGRFGRTKTRRTITSINSQSILANS